MKKKKKTKTNTPLIKNKTKNKAIILMKNFKNTKKMVDFLILSLNN